MTLSTTSTSTSTSTSPATSTATPISNTMQAREVTAAAFINKEMRLQCAEIAAAAFINKEMGLQLSLLDVLMQQATAQDMDMLDVRVLLADYDIRAIAISERLVVTLQRAIGSARIELVVRWTKHRVGGKWFEFASSRARRHANAIC